MESELESLVRKNLKLSEDNNRLLRSMRRAAWWSTFLRILWMAVFIGVPIALYYYLVMPYYKGLSEGYEQFKQQGLQIPGVGPLLDQWLDGGHTIPASEE